MLAALSAGKFVLSHYAMSAGGAIRDDGVVRFLADGTTDASFGAAGKHPAPPGHEVWAIAALPDDRVLTVFIDRHGKDFVIERLAP
jgi:hypothetical protein